MMKNRFDVRAYVNRHFPDARVASNGKERIINCLWHNDTGRHLYINVEKGVYVCFSCGAKGGFLRLVRMVTKGVDVQRELAKYTAVTSEEVEKKATERFSMPKEFFKLPQYRSQDKSEFSKKARAYLNSRKISDSQISFYKIGHCIGGQFGQRVIVPVLDEFEDMVSFIARDYTGLQKPKVLTPSKLSQSSHGIKDHVYNLHVAKETRDIIITEGVFSAISSGPRAIAIFGKVASEKQLNAIVATKPLKVTILLDPDAKREAQTLAAQLSNRVPKVLVANLTNGDPNDVHPFEVQEALDNSTEYTGFLETEVWL